MPENKLFLVSSRRNTAGGLDLGARGLEVPAQERVPAQGEDWRERPPSLLNGKRYEEVFPDTYSLLPDV